MFDNFSAPGHVRGDERSAGSCGFEKYLGYAFSVVRGKAEEDGSRKNFRHVRAVTPALDGALSCPCLQLCDGNRGMIFSVRCPNDHKAPFDALFFEISRRFDKFLHAFIPEESCCKDDDGRPQRLGAGYKAREIDARPSNQGGLTREDGATGFKKTEVVGILDNHTPMTAKKKPKGQFDHASKEASPFPDGKKMPKARKRVDHSAGSSQPRREAPVKHRLDGDIVQDVGLLRSQDLKERPKSPPFAQGIFAAPR